MTTSELTTTTLEALTLAGYHVWRCNSGSVKLGARYIRMAPTGTADIIGCSPTGRFVGIEIKGPDDTLSADQLKWLREMRDRGAIVAIVKSMDDIRELAKKVVDR